MAVVERKSDLFGTGPGVPDKSAKHMRGTTRCAHGTVTSVTGDEAASVYELVRIPSNAILTHNTVIDGQLLGLTAFDLGSEAQPVGLLDINSTPVAVSRPIAELGAKHGMELWEQLGYAADPGGEIAIVLIPRATVSAGGAAPFFFEWVVAN